LQLNSGLVGIRNVVVALGFAVSGDGARGRFHGHDGDDSRGRGRNDTPGAGPCQGKAGPLGAPWALRNLGALGKIEGDGKRGWRQIIPSFMRPSSEIMSWFQTGSQTMSTRALSM